MRIAVCYSGLYRPWDGWKTNHLNLLSSLGNPDVYYSTWESERGKVDDVPDMHYFSQPEVKYNTYKVPEFVKMFGAHVGDKPDERKRLYTSTLQHLAHAKLVNKIGSKYDLIVRMRYDTIIGNHDWKSYAESSLKFNKSISFGNATSNDDDNPLMHLRSPRHVTLRGRALDFMNMHPTNMLVDVLSLHLRKKLMPTNAGWYQCFGKNACENLVGGIQLKRYT